MAAAEAAKGGDASSHQHAGQQQYDNYVDRVVDDLGAAGSRYRDLLVRERVLEDLEGVFYSPQTQGDCIAAHVIDCLLYTSPSPRD